MIFPNNPKAEEVAQEVVEKYLLKAPGNTKVLEEEIAELRKERTKEIGRASCRERV